MQLPAATERLCFVPFTADDLPLLRRILTDEQTMLAYEGPFNEDECRDWLDRQLARYASDGIGLWRVHLRDAQTGEPGAFVGQCGLTPQRIGDPGAATTPVEIEVGYLFVRDHWGQGYAAEAARASRDHAFEVLGVDQVWSKVRDSNLASMNVAIRNGMTVRARWIQPYRGAMLPHLGFRITRSEWESGRESPQRLR